MSRIEDMAELTRLNKRLRAERDTALKRAEERYKDMMHANRHAERADQALKKEIWERHDDQTKATNLFCRYKETIHALQSGSTHMQQAGSSAEHVQTLQTDNARLQATLSEQKEQAARQQTRAEETIRRLHAKIESDQTQIRKEAAQHWEATQMLEWQKKQMQQQTAQRTGLQIQQVNAGIHAGFPMPPNRALAGRKRHPTSAGDLTPWAMLAFLRRYVSKAAQTRLDRMLQLPRRRGSHCPAPESKAAHAAADDPNRQSTTCRQQKRPSRLALSRSHNNHRENHSRCLHIFRLRVKLSSALRKRSHPSTNGLRIELANKQQRSQCTRHSSINVSTDWLSRTNVQPGYSSGNNFHSSHLRADIPPSQQTLLPAKTLLTPLGQTAGASHMQHVHPTHGHHRYEQGKQQEDSFQDTQQSPAVSNQDRTSASFTSTTDRNATLPKAFSNNAVHIQATPTQAIVDIGELEAAQLAFQLRSAGIERRRLLQHGGTQPAPSSINSQQSMQNSNFENFPAMTGGTMPSAPFTQAGQPVASHWNQQALGVQLQQQCESRDHAIALLQRIRTSLQRHERARHTSRSICIPPALDTPSSPAFQPTIQPSPSTTPSHSPQAPSTPSITTRNARSFHKIHPRPHRPVIAVCLHCHQNWWNESCDAGEPCFNCMGSHTACERPQCLSFAAGTCTTARCARVHEGDAYRNVVVKPKTLKRVGKKGEQKISPSVLAYQQGQFR
ncbi:hypothetical protein EJ07DRAFT_160660 [Lizonia empirigonia]|nr:hypothetical protein EJ07DRAFT_160660 [Lizonia empirigonia]